MLEFLKEKLTEKNHVCNNANLLLKTIKEQFTLVPSGGINEPEDFSFIVFKGAEEGPFVIPIEEGKVIWLNKKEVDRWFASFKPIDVQKVSYMEIFYEAMEEDGESYIVYAKLFYKEEKPKPITTTDGTI